MGFWPRRKDKLYKQWSEHSGLPVEAIPKKEVAPKREEVEERPVRAGRGEQRLPILYILLGVAILLVIVGVVILFMQVS